MPEWAAVGTGAPVPASCPPSLISLPASEHLGQVTSPLRAPVFPSAHCGGIGVLGLEGSSQHNESILEVISLDLAELRDDPPDLDALGRVQYSDFFPLKYWEIKTGIDQC